MSSVRKSSRNSKTSDSPTVTAQQSRITEFVNVKKRASLITGKQAAFKGGDSETESSCPGTPIRVKRKPVEARVSGETVKIGVLTPCPSIESVNEVKLEPASLTTSTVSTDTTEPIEPTTIVASTVPANVTTIEPTESEIPSTPVIPAYKRFAHLVQNVRNQRPKLEEPTEKSVIETDKPHLDTERTDSYRAVPWLPLNDKWSFYEKLIFNVDSLCVLAAGRSQPCIFHKIQKTLENVLGRQVPLEQMERLKTLWPEAYEYRENRVIMQGKRIDSVAISVPGIADTESSAALLNERREEVKGRVQHHLIKVHNAQLGLNAPEPVIPKQWSDKFDQDKVEELERTSLISRIHNEPVIRPGTPKLITEIIESSTPSTPVKQNSSLSNSPSISDSIPPGAPVKQQLSLLERIRAKEQAIQAKKCFADPETARISAILSQMDRFTQSVMFTFSSSKKTSLFLTDLTAKLVQSASIPLSPAEVLERLKLLEKAAPEWIKIVDDSDSCPKHVKILEKNRTLQSILESIKSLKQ